MGDVNLEIKLNNIDERVIKIEENGGSGGDGYITSVSNDFNVVNKKLSLSDSVTTKLSKVDDNSNNIKGIIGGDEWVNGGSYTIGKSVVIDENKLYLLVGDGGSTTKPSTDTTHLIWKETSISALTEELMKYREIKSFAYSDTTSGNGIIPVSLDASKYIPISVEVNNSSYFASTRTLYGGAIYVCIEQYSGERVGNVNVSGTVYCIEK